MLLAAPARVLMVPCCSLPCCACSCFLQVLILLIDALSHTQEQARHQFTDQLSNLATSVLTIEPGTQPAGTAARAATASPSGAARKHAQQGAVPAAAGSPQSSSASGEAFDADGFASIPLEPAGDEVRSSWRRLLLQTHNCTQHGATSPSTHLLLAAIAAVCKRGMPARDFTVL